MSKENLERVLGRLINDASWRNDFFAKPDQALSEIELSEAERKILKAVRREQIQQFQSGIAKDLGDVDLAQVAGGLEWEDRTTD